MSLHTDTERKGKQEPRIKYLPRPLKDTQCAYFATELLREHGTHLFEWEQEILRAWMSRDPETDMPLYTRGGLSVPRQNGKTLVVEALELYTLAVEGGRILHTAHRVKTTKEAFSRMVQYFSEDSALYAMVKQIRRTNGEEAIELINGGLIQYSSRSRANARGFAGISMVVFDEAQELTDAQLESMLYTLAASKTGDRQMFYLGTPPDPECVGTVFPRMRQSVLDATDLTCAWFEWSVETPPPPNTHFEDIIDDVYDTNPSMGYTLSLDFTKEEFLQSSLEGFARERLGWWASNEVGHLIDKTLWDSLATTDPPLEGKTAYGVKFSPDGEVVSLAVCLIAEERPPYIEVIEHKSCKDGIGWLKLWLAERWKKTAAIVIDGNAYAVSLLEGLLELGVPRRCIYPPRSTTMAASASMFLEAVNAKNIVHFDQPLLNESALGARKRKIGSLGSFSFMSESADVTPLEAVALAYHGAKTSKRNPTRTQRVIKW